MTIEKYFYLSAAFLVQTTLNGFRMTIYETTEHYLGKPVVEFGMGGKVENPAAIHRLRQDYDAEETQRDLLDSVAGAGNVTLVAALCGHASVQTTQRYIGWRPDGVAEIDRLYPAA